ncbi:MAG: FtsX-like permease family protein [Bacteroidia bacterium]|nr:FtsX-like permease family protein [Bacteroidia bacterium]
MMLNYFKLAWRNIKSDTFFSGLNILGLGLGLAISLLIVQYLRGEWYVDKHHESYEDIYRVNTTFDFGESKDTYATGPSPLANKLLTDYPEVSQACRLFPPPGINKYLLKKGELTFFEEKGIYADSSFFQIFNYPFLEGNPTTALAKPNDIVISKGLAEKLFRKETALGKTVVINTTFGDMNCLISGVIDTKKYRSHIDFKLFINMESGVIGNRFANLDEWAGNNMYFTYLKFLPTTDPANFEEKFPALVEATAGERLRTLGFSKAHSLLALKDIYLSSEVKANIGPRGNKSFFYIFAAIGFFILLIACINFMNLATAKSSLRATEVAVKKAIGATRLELALQFFTETILYVSLSLVVAALFIYFGQNYLASNLGIVFSFDSWFDGQILGWTFLILALCTCLAGSYPALMLSSFSPASIFHGKLGNNFSAAQLRRVLVVVQFVISIMLIQGILVIKQQMQYIQNEDLGYSKSEKIVLPLSTSIASQKAYTLKQELEKIPAIGEAGLSSTHPGLRSIEDMLVYGEEKSREENIHVGLNWADRHFMSTMGFEMLKGRNFREKDSLATIITEGALGALGYNLENALNKKIRWNWNGTENSREIVGIIKDFHSESLKNPVQPQVFLPTSPGSQAYLIASIRTENIQQSISQVQDAWGLVNEADPFEFYFLNERVQHAYESEVHMSSLITVFTVLAILISCLGLLGLSAFAADRRKKEIGVRKVLGASVASIVQLLSREFLVLICIAVCIASPIAWYFSAEWLGTFTYRIEMPWQVYVWAGLIALLICLATVSIQSIRAAQANPVHSLKTE